jgi:cell division protein FtsW (lipid II flippase)
VIGKKKTAVYVVLVTIFSTLAGLIFGVWVNGAKVWVVLGLLVASIAVMALTLAGLTRLGRRKAAAVETSQRCHSRNLQTRR